MMPTIHTSHCDADKSAESGSSKSESAALQLHKSHSALELLKGVCIFFIQYFLFFSFACFVLLLGAAYISLGRPVNVDEVGKFASSTLELLGLLLLHHTIRMRGSVAGISGTTVLMYGFVYGQRMALSWPGPRDEWKDLDFDVSFGFVSLLLTLDIVKCVWYTHYPTYQTEFEVLKPQYTIPGCFLAALLVRPDFSQWSMLFGYSWAVCLYMDALALLPQVMMMAQGGGKVEAPIAHFVAGTFLSRVDDLWDSLSASGNVFRDDNPISYWAVIFMQSFHLLLVADFIYYWIKARGHKCSLMQEVDLLADELYPSP